jgi:dATP pyrophosphohydrolase
LPHKIPISTLVLVATRDLRGIADRARGRCRLLAIGHRQPGARRNAARDREPRAPRGDRHRRRAYGGLDDWKLSNVYEIYPRWRHRYAPDTTHNTEHVFALEVPRTSGRTARSPRASRHTCGCRGRRRRRNASRGRTAMPSGCCRSALRCVLADGPRPRGR